MIKDYKILVLYSLKDIKIIELRKLIWEKIFDNKDLELMNQEWYEIDLHELDYLHELDSDIEGTKMI